MLQRGDDERGDGLRAGVVGVNDLPSPTGVQLASPRPFDLLEGKVLGPLAFDGVEDLALAAARVEDGGEGVFLAGEPAFAGIVYTGDITSGGGDVGRGGQLDKGFTVDEAFDVDVGEGNEVGFGFGERGGGGGFGGRGESEKRVANLANVDRAAKGGFLAVIALELLKSSDSHSEGLDVDKERF